MAERGVRGYFAGLAGRRLLSLTVGRRQVDGDGDGDGAGQCACAVIPQQVGDRPRRSSERVGGDLLQGGAAMKLVSNPYPSIAPSPRIGAASALSFR